MASRAAYSPQCRHLDEERESATGRKKISPDRQPEDQIATGEAPAKKTGIRKKRWRSIRKKMHPKNPAKPCFQTGRFTWVSDRC
jgi:hypothetical protein